jgi:hypothetical protein
MFARASAAVVAAGLLMADIPPSVRAVDPFQFFRPSVGITEEDRRQLDDNEPIARMIPSVDGEIAVFAAVRINVDGDRLVTWIRRIEELKRSSYVPSIGRISDPPHIEDFADLQLDEEDVNAVRECRPQRCDIALSTAEIGQMQRVVAGAGMEWRAAVQREFRRIALQRVQAYITEGQLTLQRFPSILAHSLFLTLGVPAFAKYLDAYPHAPIENVESFLYWSKERLAGRAIVSVTHVSIVRGEHDVPETLVAGKQIFATHYLTASLGVTAIVRDASTGVRYLAYLNRSEVDVLDRWYGGMVRWFAERRVRSEAADVLRGLRTRLESGDPPAVSRDSP